MDITEASKRTNCPDERQDLMDDHLLHREDEEKVVVEENIEDTLTNDIEKDPPVKPKVKRPRTKAQQEAFKKAQLALKAKREKEKERKASAPKKARGRPAKKQKPKKETRVVFEDSESETSSSESDQEIVYVQRRKKAQRKLRKPRDPRIVYVTDSSEEEQEARGPPPDWFKFV